MYFIVQLQCGWLVWFPPHTHPITLTQVNNDTNQLATPQKNSILDLLVNPIAM